MKYLLAIILSFIASQTFARGSLECIGAERLSKTSAVGLPGFGSPITITFWERSADPGANRVMVEMANTAITSQMGIGWRAAGPDLQATKAGGTTLVGMDAPILALGWHHIAYTWDGTTNRLCVDGSSCATRNVTQDAGQFNTLFVCDDTFTALLVGKIADLHIASATYTTEEILESSRCADFKHSKEVLHIPFDDGTSIAAVSQWNDLNPRKNHIGRVAGTPRIDWDGPPLSYCYSGAPQ